MCADSLYVRTFLVNYIYRQLWGWEAADLLKRSSYNAKWKEGTISLCFSVFYCLIRVNHALWTSYLGREILSNFLLLALQVLLFTSLDIIYAVTVSSPIMITRILCHIFITYVLSLLLYNCRFRYFLMPFVASIKNL